MSTKLSPAQLDALRRMASGNGIALCPGGYAKAGPDASRWWRTMGVLHERGFVVRNGWQAYAITDAGRAHVAQEEVSS